jgi:hypothetical protein
MRMELSFTAREAMAPPGDDARYIAKFAREEKEGISLIERGFFNYFVLEVYSRSSVWE